MQPVYASFWKRFFAIVIDFVFLVFVVIIIPGIVVFAMKTSVAAGLPDVLANIIGYGLIIIYIIYFIGSRGQTFGKMAMRIKVVKLGTTDSPGYFKAFLREIIGKLLSVFLLLGYFWMLWDPQKQTWHDKIAGTIVIKL